MLGLNFVRSLRYIMCCLVSNFFRNILCIYNLIDYIISVCKLKYNTAILFRYVDDSHSSLKREYVDEFHHHLNSINPRIQFTLELEVNNQLAFLDTHNPKKSTYTGRHTQETYTHRPIFKLRVTTPNTTQTISGIIPLK